jgi:hypothetical protein
MTKKTLVITLSIVAGWFGILSIGGAILVKDVNFLLRIVILANGLILFAGVGSLLNNRGVASRWFLLSAILYYIIAWLDKFLTYGFCPIILPFIPEFYWSLGIRFLLAAFAYALLRDSEGI